MKFSKNKNLLNSDNDKKNKRKRIRNWFYLISGILMITIFLLIFFI